MRHLIGKYYVIKNSISSDPESSARFDPASKIDGGAFGHCNKKLEMCLNLVRS